MSCFKGKCVKTINYEKGVETAVQDDSGRISASNMIGEVILLSLEEGKAQMTYRGYSRPVKHLSFPTKKTLLTGSSDKTTRLWIISTGQYLWIFAGHGSAISFLQPISRWFIKFKIRGLFIIFVSKLIGACYLPGRFTHSSTFIRFTREHVSTIHSE